MVLARHFVEDQLRKFRDIRRRMEAALDQLADADVNWRPNDQSNSVSNLVVHVCGNLIQRFGHNVAGQPDVRDRAAEFSPDIQRSVPELKAMLADTWAFITPILDAVTEEQLLREVAVRDQQFTVLHLIAQTSTHASEHLGQILYIAKMRSGAAYDPVWQPPR